MAPSFNIGVECCDRWVRAGAGERTALHLPDRRLSFAELTALSNQIGNALRACGLARGDRFLVRLPATAEGYATVLGGLKIGAVAVPAPLLFGPRELEEMVRAAGIELAVTDERSVAVLREIRGRVATLHQVLSFGSPERDTVAFGDVVTRAPAELESCPTTLEDPAFVLFTSGTTGRPTGIAHAHRAFNLAQGDPCGRVGMGLEPDDIVLHPHDLAFSYAFGCGFLFPLHGGASVVASGDRLTPERVGELIARHRVTVLASVPTMYRALLSLEIEQRFDLSSLRRCLSAGEPLPPQTHAEWKARLGLDLLEHIGQAELQMFCANTPATGIEPGSLGRPLPGYSVAVLDDDGTARVGEIGHLVIRDDNPALFYEYVGQPDRWRRTHREGWYYTGDLAIRDEAGFFWYVARADDLIKSRGYLISPREVEETLHSHPAVLEVAVVAVPDAAIGQRVKAFVVLQPGHAPSVALAEDLQRHVKALVAPYKAPKDIEFVAALPRGATGKVLRRALR